MARENKAFINGKIQEIRYIPNKEKPIQIIISLNVIRRPEVHAGNKSGTIRNDSILLNIRNIDLVKYVLKSNAEKDDYIIASGPYCVEHNVKNFKCPYCGNFNLKEGVASYINPLYLQVYEIAEKNYEDVVLDKYEKWSNDEEIKDCIKEKMKKSGKILSMEKDPKENRDGSVTYHVISREDISKKEEIEWMENIKEVSNFIYLIGNVCNEPTLKEDDRGGRYCSYQLAVNRKIFIPEDDPDNDTDFPWIKTLGEQATLDMTALKPGARVAIEGAIQKRDIKKRIIHCNHCDQDFPTADETTEIVPYSIEYLANYNKIGSETDDEMDVEYL